MKIVQINAVCGTSSTGRICSDLADSLISDGHECKILYGNGTSTYPHGINVSNKWLVKLNALRARITGNDMGGCFISTWRIIRFLKKYKPDVVHLHNVHAHFVNLPILCRYLAKNDIPTVITLHDCWFFTGGCTHYTVAQCNRWQKECANCPGYSNGINSWFFNKSASSFKKKRKALLSIPRLAVIGVSDWVTNEAKKSFLQKATIIKRIYNWIDSSVFYPRQGNLRQQFNLPENQFLILCIGAGWSPSTQKYQDLMCLAGQLPANMSIALAGQVYSDKPLPHNIIQVGYISNLDRLAQLYSAVDAYVHLSYEDTFGKVIAEAIACGTPAIVYNSTACPELISENYGKVVKPGNISEIVEHLVYLSNINASSSFRKESTAPSPTSENFLLEKLKSNTIQFYRKVADN